MLGIAEFVIVSVVTPAVPAASPFPTPTLDLLATPTITLEAGEVAPPAEGMEEGNSTPSPLPTISVGDTGCIPDQLIITSPRPDEVIKGEVEVRGTADTPNFGFYKVEIARETEPLWLTIQAGRSPINDGLLVPSLDTSRLPPDNYVLQLVIVDLAGEAMPPCRIPVRIEAP